MLNELNILKLTCQRLDKAGIPYMLTGSFASNFYAVPRMTRNIDIVIAIQESDVSELYRLFKEDFYINKDSISEAITYLTMFNAIHNDSVFKIDFIIRKSNLYRNLEFQRRCQIQLDGIQIWIVAPEDLIISKLFWSKDSFSEIQVNDVRNLFASIKNLDREYIKEWVEKLELRTIFDRLQSNA